MTSRRPSRASRRASPCSTIAGPSSSRQPPDDERRRRAARGRRSGTTRPEDAAAPARTVTPAPMSAPSSTGPSSSTSPGCSATAVGADRTYDIADARIELPDDLELAEPDRRPRAADPREPRDPRRRPTDDGPRRRVRALPSARSRRRSRSSSTRSTCPRSTSRRGRPLAIDDEPEALRLTDHHEVDLEPSVRDAISLAEPIAPLDRPDCPGLCIVCGLPLDEGDARSPRRRHRPAAGGPAGVPAATDRGVRGARGSSRSATPRRTRSSRPGGRSGSPCCRTNGPQRHRDARDGDRRNLAPARRARWRAGGSGLRDRSTSTTPGCIRACCRPCDGAVSGPPSCARSTTTRTSAGSARPARSSTTRGHSPSRERFGFREVDRQIEQTRTIGVEPEPVIPAGHPGRDRRRAPGALGGRLRPVRPRGHRRLRDRPPVVVTRDEWERDWLVWPEAMFLALDGDEIVGCAGLAYDPTDPTAPSTRSPRSPGRGGDAVWPRAQADDPGFAAEHGISEVYTWTQRDNADMRALNERLGYVYPRGEHHGPWPVAAGPAGVATVARRATASGRAPPDVEARFAVDSAVGAAARPDPERVPPPRPTNLHDTRSPRPHGCTQATRLARPPGRATLAPGDRPADARGVPALPRDEAAAPRLPELRLVPGPPGGRARSPPAVAATAPPADPVTEPRPVRPRPHPGRRPRRHRRDGRRPRPAEVVPGALDFARAHPGRPADPRRRRGHRRGASPGTLPANVRIVHASPGRRHGRAPRAGPAREEGRLASSSRPTSSGTAKPMPSSPPATPGPGWPPRSCASAACRASTVRRSRSR